MIKTISAENLFKHPTIHKAVEQTFYAVMKLRIAITVFLVVYGLTMSIAYVSTKSWDDQARKKIQFVNTVWFGKQPALAKNIFYLWIFTTLAYLLYYNFYRIVRPFL